MMRIEKDVALIDNPLLRAAIWEISRVYIKA